MLVTPPGLHVVLRSWKKPAHRPVPVDVRLQRCQPGACGGEFHLTCKEPGSCDDRGRGAHGAARDPRIVEVDVEFAQSHQRERQRLDWTSDPSSAGADHVQVYAMECWVEVVPVPLALHLVVRDVVIRRGVATSLQGRAQRDQLVLGRGERGQTPLSQGGYRRVPKRSLLLA